MNDSISKRLEDEATSASAFEFKHIKILDKYPKIFKVLQDQEPKVMLCSEPSLDWPSLSRPVLAAMAKAPENLVVLVDETVSGSAQAQLLQLWKDRQDGIALEKVSGSEGQLEQVYGGGQVVSFPRQPRMPLDAADLQSLQDMVARRQLENSLKTPADGALMNAEDAIEEDSSSSSDESDEEHQGRVLNVTNAMGGKRNKVALSDEELGVSVLLRRHGVHDYDVRNRKGRNAVFPFTRSRRRGDEYGDYIRPEDFLRAAEKDAAQAAASQPHVVSPQKRKWEVSTDDSKNSANKRLKQFGFENKHGGADNFVKVGNEDEESNDTDREDESKALPEMADNLFINARLALVDFSGIHDQRSLQMLIPLIGSKKLVLIEGTEKETTKLREDCEQLLSIQRDSTSDAAALTILAPGINETVDVSVDADTWDIRVGKLLFKKLHFAPVQGRNIATVTGELKPALQQSSTDLPEHNKKKKLMKVEPASMDPDPKRTDRRPDGGAVLDVVPATMARSALSMDRPIHVGDVVLRELQRFMMNDGHKARFVGGGTLLVDDMVAVRKLGTGKIVVEGTTMDVVSASNGLAPPNSFTQVKRKIYQTLPVVAAG